MPVCYCFGFTRGDVEGAAARKSISNVSEGVAEALRLRRENPQGACCLGTWRVIRTSYPEADCTGGADALGTLS